MKKIGLLFYCGFVFAQTPQIIKLKEYYKGEGVILDKSVHYPFGEIDYKDGYTPTIKDIKKTEEYFFTIFYEYEYKTLESLGLNKTKEKLNKKLKKVSCVKKKFHRYNRQYGGYINNSNDTIIYVGFLNFKDNKAANDYFESWRHAYIGGTGHFYYSNTRKYWYNLSKKKYILNVE